MYNTLLVHQHGNIFANFPLHPITSDKHFMNTIIRKPFIFFQYFCSTAQIQVTWGRCDDGQRLEHGGISTIKQRTCCCLDGFKLEQTEKSNTLEIKERDTQCPPCAKFGGAEPETSSALPWSPPHMRGIKWVWRSFRKHTHVRAHTHSHTHAHVVWEWWEEDLRQFPFCLEVNRPLIDYSWRRKRPLVTRHSHPY